MVRILYSVIYILVLKIISANTKRYEEYLESYKNAFLLSLELDGENGGNDFFRIMNKKIEPTTEEFRFLILNALQIPDREERIFYLSQNFFHDLCTQNSNFIREYVLFREYGLDLTRLRKDFMLTEEFDYYLSRDFFYSKKNVQNILSPEML